MFEILPVVRKVIFVWFIAATDPDTATLWMTEPFVTACVRSSVFATGAFARDTKTAPPAMSPTRATAKSRPGHVVKIPLSTVIDRSPLVDQRLTSRPEKASRAPSARSPPHRARRPARTEPPER